MKIKDDFIKEVFDIWADLQYQNVIESFDDFLEQNLWNNSLVRIDDKPICFQEWIKQGIGKVKDFTKQDNVEKFLSHLEFKTMYEIDTLFLSYFSLISCLIKLQKQIKPSLNSTTSQKSNMIKNLVSGQYSTKSLYKAFLKEKCTQPLNTQKKWENDCNLTKLDETTWEKIYLKSFLYTKSYKLSYFQFKLLHRRIPTNKFLYTIKIKDNNLCTFFKTDIETIVHIFWTCEIVQTF